MRRQLPCCAVCSEHTRTKGRHHDVNGMPATPEEVAAVRASQQVGNHPAAESFSAPQAVPSSV